MRYEVRKEGHDWRVIGLHDNGTTDAILLIQLDAGDWKSPETRDEMHEALYAEYQTNDDLHEGDEFDTPFGEFYCEGVHVLPREVGP